MKFLDVVGNVGTLLRRLLKSLTSTSVGRFLLAGIANTLFGFGVYSGAVLLGAPVWFALLSGIVAGVCFNFVTIGGYAFRMMSLQSFGRFVSCYLAIYVLNLWLIGVLLGWLPNAITAQLVLSAPMAAVSYVLMRHVVFRRASRQRA